jgi:DNA-binding NarL/FixJ family response regulator
MPSRCASTGQPENSGCPIFLSREGMLSPRQREVLGLAALGFTDLEISRRLVLSIYTVADHLRAIREALGARNTTHAVVLALANGQIDIDTFCAPDQGALCE